jgi:hypothetical protein
MTGLKAYDVTGQEPMADQVITMEPELSLSFCLVSRGHKVVSICAVEADMLIGGIAPLIFQLGCRQM